MPKTPAQQRDLDEMILAIPSANLGDCNIVPGLTRAPESVIRRLLKRAAYLPRGAAESDETHRQIIVYDIYECLKLIFAYRRGGDREDRLHGRWSIGVGGHVAIEDARGNATLGGIERARKRDREEELESPLRIHKSEYIGIIACDDNPVDRVHLGVVVHHHCGDLPRPNHRDWPESGMREVKDLVRDSDQFERWSQLLIAEYLAPMTA